MSDIRVLVVPADTDQPAQVRPCVPDHDTFCALVNDINTDTVFFAEGDGMVKAAANGKSLASHAPNPRATQVVERFVPGFAKRDRVEGPAVFVGLDGDGDPCDVPVEVVRFAEALFSTVAGQDDKIVG